MNEPKTKARDIKVQTVKALAEKIARAKTVAFTDYRGLTVNQISQLRSHIKEAGGELVVAKNTLISRALQVSDFKFEASSLEGPTAAIFAYEDEVAPLKTVDEAAKISGLPKFKFGFFGQDLLDAATLSDLAKIPTRPILQSKLVISLASPLYGLVSVLQGNIRNLVLVLNHAAKNIQ